MFVYLYRFLKELFLSFFLHFFLHLTFNNLLRWLNAFTTFSLKQGALLYLRAFVSDNCFLHVNLILVTESLLYFLSSTRSLVLLKSFCFWKLFSSCWLDLSGWIRALPSLFNNEPCSTCKLLFLTIVSLTLTWSGLDLPLIPTEKEIYPCLPLKSCFGFIKIPWILLLVTKPMFFILGYVKCFSCIMRTNMIRYIC